MKCPHCGYQTGMYWNTAELFVKAEEEYGAFFKSSPEQHMPLKRGSLFRDNAEEATICGCPRCMKTFIEVE